MPSTRVPSPSELSSVSPSWVSGDYRTSKTHVGHPLIPYTAAFAFKFDFPPFMVLIIAILNDGTIMTLSVDRVLPSSTPDSWDLGEIFAYVYQTAFHASSLTDLLSIFFRSSFGFRHLRHQIGHRIRTLPSFVDHHPLRSHCLHNLLRGPLRGHPVQGGQLGRDAHDHLPPGSHDLTSTHLHHSITRLLLPW